MSFQPSPLDPTVKFTDNDKIDVKWVTGKGQQIYFKECNITYFVRDSKGNKDDGTICPEQTGQIVVKSGIDLYCFGGHLKVG